MSLTLQLPQADGTLAAYTLSQREPWRAPIQPAFDRIAYSAAHVVADPRATIDPWGNYTITLARR